MRSVQRPGRRDFLASAMGSSVALLLGACGGGSDENSASAQGTADARANGAKGKPRRRARSYDRTGVTAIVASRDGSAIGVANSDGRVRLMDGSGARDVRLLKAAGSAVAAGLVFSADGRYLVTVGRDSVAEFWNVETGERRISLRGHEHALRTVAASADGSVVATGGEETRVMVWDGQTGKLKRILSGHTDFVNTLAVSPNGALLASGDADARILVWQLASGTLLHTLRGHADEVNAVAFSADGALLASASEDGKVILWDVAAGRQLQALDGHRAPVRSLAFNDDGSLLAGGGFDGRVLVWDMATRKVSRDVTGSSGAVNVVAFDRKRRDQLLVGDDKDGVLTWKASTR
jgi:WD40 repeat protein